MSDQLSAQVISITEKLEKHFNIYKMTSISEPPHDKTNKMACVPIEDSDQSGLIRVFAVPSMGSLGPNVSSCGQQRL